MQAAWELIIEPAAGARPAIADARGAASFYNHEMAATRQYRVERDPLGETRVPTSAYYGGQTPERSRTSPSPG